MDTNQTYQVNLSVLIKPIWCNQPPIIKIGLNGITEDITLDKETWFNYNYTSTATTDILQIELYGKANNDSDTAVIIEEVKFNGISNPKFAWAGTYIPNYPLHYIKVNPTSASTLSPHTYLGWNGIWTLKFTVPIFTWIHKVEGLGWIYD
jgi:hypothetical protein